MEKLLQWSIASQSGDKETMDKIGKPDPEMLSKLFGNGPDEPTLMKQSIEVVENPEATDEAKETALENFEMLVENLDNANNIENLKLWPSVIAQLLGSNLNLSVLAASIIGVATQNNPNSQKAFLEKENGLEILINLVKADSTPRELALKALFALSCFVRNYPEATERFTNLGGWEALHLQGSHEDHKLLLRKLSLTSALLSTGLDEKKLDHFKNSRFVDNLISTFDSQNVGCIDKALNIISQLQSLQYKFTSDEIKRLVSQLESVSHLKDKFNEEDYHTATIIASQ